MRRGFLLIELLFGIALSGIMLAVGAYFLIQLQGEISTISEELVMVQRECLVLACMRKDFVNAPADKTLWKLRQKNAVVWSHGGVDYGYWLEGENLFRAEGSYNDGLRTWNKRSRSLVLENVMRIAFMIDEDHALVKGLTYSLIVKSSTNRFLTYTGYLCCRVGKRYRV